MKTHRLQAIDEFVKSVAIDCYETVPYNAKIVVVCKPLETQPGGIRVFSFSAVYSADNTVRGTHEGVVQVECGKKLDDYGMLIGAMLKNYRIPTTIRDEYINEGKMNVPARVVEIYAKSLQNKCFDAGTAANALRVSTDSVVNAYMRVHGYEPTGSTSMCVQDLFLVARRLRIPDNEFLNRVGESNLPI